MRWAAPDGGRHADGARDRAPRRPKTTTGSPSFVLGVVTSDAFQMRIAGTDTGTRLR